MKGDFIAETFIFDNLHFERIEKLKTFAKINGPRLEMTHSQALEFTAKLAGFKNFAEAKKTLTSSRVPRRYEVYLSATHHVTSDDEMWSTAIRVRLSRPLDQLIKARHYSFHRSLRDFMRVASDHLELGTVCSEASTAMIELVHAARTLQFMDATGLVPATPILISPTDKACPDLRMTEDESLPGSDHRSRWFHQKSRRYIDLDEPYTDSVSHLHQARQDWAERNDWSVVRVNWRGIYFPERIKEVYLITHNKLGYPAANILPILNGMPSPITETNCDLAYSDKIRFKSPAQHALDISPFEHKASSQSRKAVTTSTYYGAPIERPEGKLPTEVHQELGRVLLSINEAARTNQFKLELDIVLDLLSEWASEEEEGEDDDGRVRLPPKSFCYKRSQNLPSTNYINFLCREEMADALIGVKKFLKVGYRDCEALRYVLAKLDSSMNTLLK